MTGFELWTWRAALLWVAVNVGEIAVKVADSFALALHAWRQTLPMGRIQGRSR